MTLLIISPDFASHFAPLAVLGRAAALQGERVVVATGPALRPRVQAEGFEWRSLPLGPESNAGVATRNPGIDRFIEATTRGALATIEYQAIQRERDLLWRPEWVAQTVEGLLAELDPSAVLVDHVSFGSTLAMYASGRDFVTLVPGHPSQLPVGDEQYGVPATWPHSFRPDPDGLADLQRLASQVGAAFTERWNEALALVAPQRPPVADAYRVHGHRVLYNSIARHHDPERTLLLPTDHRFVGPLVRSETLPTGYESWHPSSAGRSHVFVAFGTFLSYRSDVLQRVASGLQKANVRAAIATGETPSDSLGPVPDDWIIAPVLPQVALLAEADLAIHHGGNNSTQEALAAGARQIIMPFSTDQFANGADQERTATATTIMPNDFSADDIATEAERLLNQPPPQAIRPLTDADLVMAVYD